MKNNEIMTLIIIGSNISGTLEDCIHSHHLSSTMRPMDFGQVNRIERQQFSEFSVEARYSKRNPGPPSLSQRDVEAPGAGGKCFQPQQVSFNPLVVKPGDRTSCFYS